MADTFHRDRSAALRRVLRESQWLAYRHGSIDYNQFIDLKYMMHAAFVPETVEVPRLEDDGGPMLYAIGEDEDPENPKRDDGPTPRQVRLAREHFGHSVEEAADVAKVSRRAWLAAETGGKPLRAVDIDSYVLRASYAAAGEPWPWAELCSRLGIRAA